MGKGTGSDKDRISIGKVGYWILKHLVTLKNIRLTLAYQQVIHECPRTFSNPNP